MSYFHDVRVAILTHHLIHSLQELIWLSITILDLEAVKGGPLDFEPRNIAGRVTVHGICVHIYIYVYDGRLGKHQRTSVFLNYTTKQAVSTDFPNA